jgi:hypothetical protein
MISYATNKLIWQHLPPLRIIQKSAWSNLQIALSFGKKAKVPPQ